MSQTKEQLQNIRAIEQYVIEYFLLSACTIPQLEKQFNIGPSTAKRLANKAYEQYELDKLENSGH